MRRGFAPVSGKRLLFWDDLVGGELQPLLDFFDVVPGGKRYGQPREHVFRNITREAREEVGRALQLRSPTNPIGGGVLMGYMGWADCRICGDRLGTRDFFGHGFVWPEKADHYVLEHDVWTPECAELHGVLQRAKRPA